GFEQSAEFNRVLGPDECRTEYHHIHVAVAATLVMDEGSSLASSEVKIANGTVANQGGVARMLGVLAQLELFLAWCHQFLEIVNNLGVGKALADQMIELERDLAADP